MTTSALALLTLSLGGCQLYFDHSPTSDGPTIADPSQLIGSWLAQDGAVYELSPTGYWLAGSGSETDTSFAVGRFDTEFGRPHNLILTDDTCGSAIGRYEWSRQDDVLELELIDDPCVARRERMSEPFVAMTAGVAGLPEHNALVSLDDHYWLEETAQQMNRTGCTDCAETLTLGAVARGDRWMLIESVTAVGGDGQVQAQCEIVSDLRANPLRLMDPLERVAARTVIVESDCAMALGATRRIAIERTDEGFSTWPLVAGFVRPDNDANVTEYRPHE